MSRTWCLVAIIASAMGASGCSVNPATGESQLILVSPQEVLTMGEQAQPELTRQYGGEVRSPQLRTYITRVGKKLAREVESEYTDLPWKFTALDSDVINAFALPGGKVFISRGLLDHFDNEAQVAAVLGHEIGHVTGRHIDERISRSMALDLGLQLGTGLTDSQLASAVGQLFGQGYILKFSRDQESQADELGLKYMVRAGYSPEGMVDVLKILISADKGGRTWEMLSTHPDPEKRLAAVQEMIRRDYSFTRGGADYQKFRGRFQRDAAPYLKGAARSGLLPDPASWCAICAAHQHRAVNFN